MIETGLLNSEMADAFSKIGHMDEFMIVDAGFPLPSGVRIIDLAISKNKPTINDVLIALIQNFSIEKIVLANETGIHNPMKLKEIVDLFNINMPVEMISHVDLKRRSSNVKVIVRTGDFTSFSNILLISGAGNQWFTEI